MKIEDMTRIVRAHTYGLLNDGEVVSVVEMALQAHGGVDPEDINDIEVLFGNGKLDVRFIIREPETDREIIDLSTL